MLIVLEMWASSPPSPQALCLEMDEIGHDRNDDEELDFPQEIVDALTNKKLLKHKDASVRCVQFVRRDTLARSLASWCCRRQAADAAACHPSLCVFVRSGCTSLAASPTCCVCTRPRCHTRMSRKS